VTARIKQNVQNRYVIIWQTTRTNIQFIKPDA